MYVTTPGLGREIRLTSDLNAFNLKKKSENFVDFRGGDGPSNRFFERAPTFTNFLRRDSDRTSQEL